MDQMCLFKVLLGANLIKNHNNSFQIPLEDFETRLIIQKFMYIFKKMDPSIDYAYNWYLRGPYSPSLTNDCFTLAEQMKNNPNKFKLKEDHDDLVQRAAKLKQRIDGFISKLPESHKYELFASILYLKNNFIRQGEEKDIIKQELQSRKPFINLDEFDNYYSYLSKLMAISDD